MALKFAKQILLNKFYIQWIFLILHFTNFKRFLNFIKFEFSIYSLELVALAVLSVLGAMHGNFFGRIKIPSPLSTPPFFLARAAGPLLSRAELGFWCANRLSFAGSFSAMKPDTFRPSINVVDGFHAATAAHKVQWTCLLSRRSLPPHGTRCLQICAKVRKQLKTRYYFTLAFNSMCYTTFWIQFYYRTQWTA